MRIFNTFNCINVLRYGKEEIVSYSPDSFSDVLLLEEDCLEGLVHVEIHL